MEIKGEKLVEMLVEYGKRLEKIEKKQKQGEGTRL